MHSSPDSILLAGEVAERLRVSRQTVYSMWNAGTLPSVPRGVGTERVQRGMRLADLEAYVRGENARGRKDQRAYAALAAEPIDYCGTRKVKA